MKNTILWILARKSQIQVGVMASKGSAPAEQRVAAARKAVESGHLNLRVAGEWFNVPKSTVHRHISAQSAKVGAGRPTVLTAEEEKSIVRSCQELAQLGHGVDRTTVGRVIHNYLQSHRRDNPFKDTCRIPGKKWWWVSSHDGHHYLKENHNTSQ